MPSNDFDMEYTQQAQGNNVYGMNRKRPEATHFLNVKALPKASLEAFCKLVAEKGIDEVLAMGSEIYPELRYEGKDKNGKAITRGVTNVNTTIPMGNGNNKLLGGIVNNYEKSVAAGDKPSLVVCLGIANANATGEIPEDELPEF
jgi:hypothetical protein